ncbi:homoserine dehydrogenase [Hirschia baltica]|uniref:Homoserine dehydrogenase n=1 Tax=Hirschia baltica (strain ATCC 49814 / DSM 5838 / IFAM 1418) TaxID=582402 RepID=C6XKI3_HIRBI|nr:homoserine dehydrogenase [Hirschia baltica]ACT59550.1 Homoserine dehydrogenase [Hirschia baltica ATCC 49814]
MTEQNKLRIGIAGLGNVGVGLVKLVNDQESLRLPGEMVISAVSARSKTRDRGIDLSGIRWEDDPVKLAISDDIDVYVELIGGSDGPARLSIEAALKAGKHVVTANKAVVAEHGEELARLAEENNVHLLFDAAVAGGVPIVRVIRDSLSSVNISRVSGILNGTCNYILSEMLTTGQEYSPVLAEAQKLGYAESDPYLDVSGMDAAHKALILSVLAFGAKPDFSKVLVSGVDQIDGVDILLSQKMGYRIRLVAEAVKNDSGVRCNVAPVLYKAEHPLAQITGPTNAVMVEGEPLGSVTMAGPGAGEGPTASAVMGDIARVLQGPATPPFGTPVAKLNERMVRAVGDGPETTWFIRTRLSDKSGALASLSKALAVCDVSIDQMHQDSSAGQLGAPIAIMTHPCTRKAAESAAAMVEELDTCVDKPRVLRVEA